MTDISFLKDFILFSNQFENEEMEVSIKSYNDGTTDLYNCRIALRSILVFMVLVSQENHPTIIFI